MKAMVISLIVIITSINACYSQTSNDTVPLRLTVFNASRLPSNTINLNWQVTCSLDFAQFAIQRSTDGINFKEINAFRADILRCLQPFDYEDKNIDTKVFYRLIVADKNGREYVSKILFVAARNTRFEVNGLTPTLVTNAATIHISSAVADKIQILVTNLQGKQVKLITTTLKVGFNELPLNLVNLAKGNYIAVISNGLNESKTVRFIKL